MKKSYSLSDLSKTTPCEQFTALIKQKPLAPGSFCSAFDCNFPADIIKDFYLEVHIPTNLKFQKDVKFTADRPEFVKYFGKHFTSVTFDGTDFPGDTEFVQLLQNFPQLERLELNMVRCHVLDSMTAICIRSILRQLKVYIQRSGFVTIPFLSQLIALEQLYIDYDFVPDDGENFEKFLGNTMPHLKELQLQSSSHWKRIDVVGLIRNLPELQVLTETGTFNHADHFRHGLKKDTKLRSLKLDVHEKLICANCCNKILVNCPELCELYLSGVQVNEESYGIISDKLHLKTFSFRRMKVSYTKLPNKAS